MRVLPIICALGVASFSGLSAQLVAPPMDGMLLWLKADAGITRDEGGRVSTWADQSGMGNDATQLDPEKRPLFEGAAINGKPALQFEKSRTVLSTEPLSPPPQFSIFVVISLNDNNYAQLIQCAPAGGEAATAVLNLLSGPNDGNGLYIYGDGGVVAITTPAQSLPLNWLEASTVSLAEVIADGYGGQTTLLRNGEKVGSSDSPFGNIRGAGKPRPLHIGGTSTGFPSANGLLAEVIIYETALSDSERQGVEKYLAEKYGISLAP